MIEAIFQQHMQGRKRPCNFSLDHIVHCFYICFKKFADAKSQLMSLSITSLTGTHCLNSDRPKLEVIHSYLSPSVHTVPSWLSVPIGIGLINGETNDPT